MDKIKQVVGVAFIKDNKLLIAQSIRSSKTNSYTLIGGGVEENETLIEAAIREVSEEIQQGFFVTENDLEPVLHFTDTAASDPNLFIEMHMFVSKKEINVELIPNDEIIDFYWYSLNDIDKNISNAIRDHFLPYAKAKELLC